jgi:hypothetical protein
MLSPQEPAPVRYAVQAAQLVASRYAELLASGEVARMAWRKSSHSGGGEGQACVEVAHDGEGLTVVRDTKDKGTGPILGVHDAAWRSFVRAVAK